MDIPTRRIAMRVMYDGGGFFGWQRQPKGRTVQEELERMLSRLAGDRPVTVVGAGRTDSGVHAHGQVAHADIAARYSAPELLHAIGRMSPSDLAVTDLVDAPADFHARYTACARAYRYAITHLRDPFQARYTWRVDFDLDLALLNEAAALLLGRHDFTSLSKHNPDTPNTVCHITRCEWARRDGRSEFFVTADRFLYGMVRLLVGLQVDIAQGRRSAAEIPSLVERRDRSLQSTSAPAHGLSLIEVSYPQPIFPERSTEFVIR
jgi:tRNA pseudouridine38-40 synthase